MKTLILTLAAATALTAGVATAQPYGEGYGRHGQWMSIGERQQKLDRRIEMGQRNGQLTRQEAWRLRREFRSIANLEARYRYNGLSRWERADLDRRFDALSAQIRYERHDNDYGYNTYPRY